LYFKIKVFVGSKIWYFNKFHLFLFSKNLGCYSDSIRSKISKPKKENVSQATGEKKTVGQMINGSVGEP
jgi:hypothetical protein